MLLIALALLPYFGPRTSYAAGSATITVNTSIQDGVSQFEGGAIHTQYGYDTGNATAVASAKNLLKTSVAWESQQFSEGWGVTSAEPSPGSYSWGSLDARMNLILNDGARPVIFYDRRATCWQKQVKDFTIVVNSIFNNGRMEDVWLDR